LEVLAGSGVHDTLIVVTRYFGGTLLGTGGLVRAYSQAAQAGLAASKIITKLSGRKVVIHTDYNGVGKLQYLVGQRGLAVLDTDYTDAVEMTVLVPEEQKGAFEKEVTEATSGQAGMEWSDELLFAVLDGAPLLFETS
jgi:putative IMPACT (imprinted ancient) family translation regulator